MALSTSRLSAGILAKLQANPRAGFSDPMSPAQVDMLRAWTDSIAEAVIAELQSNAVVTVSSVSGVTPGAGASGPGTGTVS